MKVRPYFLKTLGLLLIVILIGGGIIFSITFTFFLKPITEWGWQAYTILGIWVGTSIALILATYFLSYYEVFKKYVSVKRGRKTLIYYYSDVVYIDEKQYQKSKTIAFCTRQGHARYLVGDKEDVLYKTMMANCNNLLSEEDFKYKYPKVNL